MAEDADWREFAKDFLAGTLGGCAGVLAGHPLDTVKVRLQTQDHASGKPLRYTGTFNCFTTIIRQEKVMGLYKGMASPMAGVMVVNAMLFGVYGNALRMFHGDATGAPTISSIFKAGSISGVINSVISCPMDLMKTQMQVQGSPGAPILYTGPWDCFRQTLKSQGLRGCYRGMVATVIRETPSYGTYFASYEYLCRLMTPPGKDVSDLSPLALMVAGGMGGVCGWLSTYPSDVVKSRMQADSPVNPQYKGLVDCIVKSYKAEGYRVFSVD
eukprot:Opistho-2@47735